MYTFIVVHKGHDKNGWCQLTTDKIISDFDIYFEFGVSNGLYAIFVFHFNKGDISINETNKQTKKKHHRNS